MYSGTSNKGPSKKGTISLQRTLPISPKDFNFRKEDSLPTRDKMAGPKVSFTRRLLKFVLEKVHDWINTLLKLTPSQTGHPAEETF